MPGVARAYDGGQRRTTWWGARWHLVSSPVNICKLPSMSATWISRWSERLTSAGVHKAEPERKLRQLVDRERQRLQSFHIWHAYDAWCTCDTVLDFKENLKTPEVSQVYIWQTLISTLPFMSRLHMNRHVFHNKEAQQEPQPFSERSSFASLRVRSMHRSFSLGWPRSRFARTDSLLVISIFMSLVSFCLSNVLDSPWQNEWIRGRLRAPGVFVWDLAGTPAAVLYDVRY